MLTVKTFFTQMHGCSVDETQFVVDQTYLIVLIIETLYLCLMFLKIII